MEYIWRYQTPEGLSDLLMSSDGESLTGVWFEGSKDEEKILQAGDNEKKRKKNRQKTRENDEQKLLPVFEETIGWLDGYFAGKPPEKLPPIKRKNLTLFRSEVSDLMCAVPYGKTITYGEIAAQLAAKHGISRMSAQAVGGAVGWNPICILIPCHRVIGRDGSLTGYGGGIENKRKLLELERRNV